MNKTKKYYRVEKCYGFKDGSNYKYHGDIEAFSENEALAVATRREFKVRWRWIDTWDISDEAYKTYRVLYQLNKNEYVFI